MTRVLLGALLVAGLWFVQGASNARAADSTMALKHPDWSFEGPFGLYDRNALRRGYKVYKEVCAACHGMEQLRFRMLGQKGGPEFTPAEVKLLAAEYQVTDGPDEYGEMFERAGISTDAFPNPFPNAKAARAANGGAFPPDLSLITKARGGGVDYLYSLLTGFDETPPARAIPAGQYYNPWFAGEFTAMAPPLADGLVEYDDGTPTTTAQLSADVSHFLAWAAEPEMEERKRMGLAVMLYLLLAAGLLFISMRRIWARLK